MTFAVLFMGLCAWALYRARRSTRDAIAAMPHGPMPRTGPLPRTPPSAFLCTREHAWKNARRSGWLRLRLLLLAVCVLLAGGACSPSTADVRVRSALDVLADVIDPASQLAAESCLARQEASTTEAEAGRITADEATKEVAAIRERCDAIRAVFDEMRKRHDQARALVEQGAVEQAAAELERIRVEWQALRGAP